MKDKELKRLSRSELLEMLLEQVDENKKLKIRLDELQNRLDDRQIMINEAGSIAEAALQLNGVFQAAEAAAAQYLENIRRMNSEGEVVCRSAEEEAMKKAEAIRAEADEFSQRIRSQADRHPEEVQALTGEQDDACPSPCSCGEEYKA